MNLALIESAAARRRVDRPVLTIGIPTWNREQHLVEQLRRLSEHLAPGIELVVCDNGSNDGTWAALERFTAETSHDVRCMRNGVNLGADVNYLRVLEFSAAEWTWLVGDDDHLDFALLPLILRHLSIARADVLLLQDDPTASNTSPPASEHIARAAYFDPRHDSVGTEVLQVGRVVCRTSKSLLRVVYATLVGALHSYGGVYGLLVERNGIDVLRVPLLTDRQAEHPRWNFLHGHLGAWESSLKMYGDRHALADARETRMRTMSILVAVVERLIRDEPLDPAELRRIRVRLPIGANLFLASIRLAFAVNRGWAIGLLLKAKPDLTSQILARIDRRAQQY